jgi:hypothetical protein
MIYFVVVAPGVEVFRNTLNLAIDNLLKDYQLAMVYYF